ncbi:MAG: anti-sigma factor [Mycobacterium sp.]
MTEPTPFELPELATPYALDAVFDAERADIDRQVAAAPPRVAEAFHKEVRGVREAMAAVSATTAVEPPIRLRATLLATVQSDNRGRPRWRTAILAAAAAVAIGLTAFGTGLALRPTVTSTIAEQVLAAPDVRTVSVPLGGGTATVVFSRNRDAGVLVMNNVPPPSTGTVYQMWLIDAAGPNSAGTMDAAAVAPSTTAVFPDLGDSTALAFTVEPGTGSPAPTGEILASLSLI